MLSPYSSSIFIIGDERFRISVVIIFSANVDPGHSKKYAKIASAAEDIYKMRQSSMRTWEMG